VKQSPDRIKLKEEYELAVAELADMRARHKQEQLPLVLKTQLLRMRVRRAGEQELARVQRMIAAHEQASNQLQPATDASAQPVAASAPRSGPSEAEIRYMQEQFPSGPDDDYDPEIDG
jgi:hypothetical protein